VSEVLAQNTDNFLQHVYIFWGWEKRTLLVCIPLNANELLLSVQRVVLYKLALCQGNLISQNDNVRTETLTISSPTIMSRVREWKFYGNRTGIFYLKGGWT